MYWRRTGNAISKYYPTSWTRLAGYSSCQLVVCSCYDGLGIPPGLECSEILEFAVSHSVVVVMQPAD